MYDFSTLFALTQSIFDLQSWVSIKVSLLQLFSQNLKLLIFTSLYEISITKFFKDIDVNVDCNSSV